MVLVMQLVQSHSDLVDRVFEVLVLCPWGYWYPDKDDPESSLPVSSSTYDLFLKYISKPYISEPTLDERRDMEFGTFLLKSMDFILQLNDTEPGLRSVEHALKTIDESDCNHDSRMYILASAMNGLHPLTKLRPMAAYPGESPRVTWYVTKALVRRFQEKLNQSQFQSHMQGMMRSVGVPETEIQGWLADSVLYKIYNESFDIAESDRRLRIRMGLPPIYVGD